MKWLDRGTLLLLVGAVLFLAYIESRGGIRAMTADRSWSRKALISVPTTPAASGEPQSTSPSFPQFDGSGLFANPIAAAEGADGTMIAPMSATTGGAVRITADQLASPDFQARLYRDPDKGLLFVSLPPKLTKGSPKPHTDNGSILPSNAYGWLDVGRYYRSLVQPKTIARAFPVSQ